MLVNLKMSVLYSYLFLAACDFPFTDTADALVSIIVRW